MIEEPAVLPTPREVVLAAGDWIASQLQQDGFVWLPSRLTLQRSVGSVRHQIHVQPDTYNRRGGPIAVQAMLNVRDTALRRWRKANPQLVFDPDNDYVCGHFLGYATGRANGYLYGDFRDGEIDLSSPGERERHLDAFVATVRQSVLPWFAEASDPDLIVESRAADMTSSPACIVDWLASRGRIDLVPVYVARYVERHPEWDEGVRRGVALAADGQRPEYSTNWADVLGWTSAKVTESHPAGPATGR
ncbi:hypothetical protein SAMN05421684_7063 [Asanoa ishikariensis]|uniref:Uncharacterized protein n=2 Tax=Asanoa ishikariensis TaxID=137265 RepID=A0A1H3UDW7_9ACTN|nr:hypothetical protein SAMN05421684_7063 [Asanoa ishikariensis]